MSELPDSGERTRIYLGIKNKNGDKRGCCGIHGLSRTRIYNTWTDMKKRCYNKKNKRYANYGNRGIVVCEEWKKSFELFHEWAILNGYSDELTIDRIEINGNYEPNNCRFSDRKTQQRNTTRNHYVTAFGKTKTIVEWSEINGLSPDLIKDRLNKLSWDPEEAVTLKPIKTGKNRERKC